MQLQFDKTQLNNFCAKNDIKYLGLFGSYAQGKANEKSDIDLLVEFNKPKGFEFFTVQRDFETFFNKKVDLATKNSLSPYIKEHVLSNLVTIYEQN